MHTHQEKEENNNSAKTKQKTGEYNSNKVK